jgi:hypothetical protein
MTMKNRAFTGVTPRGSCKNRRFGGTYHLNHQGKTNQRARNVSGVLQLLVTANVVPSLLICFTLMIESILSSVTSALTRVTRCQIPEDGILGSVMFRQNYSTVIHAKR